MLRCILPVIAAAGLALAKTDIEGCTSFTSTVTVRTEIGYGNTYETVIWYVPDTLEICRGVDCGGGRAPPRKVPGCPMYSGTETVTASFLSTDPAAPVSTVITVTPTKTSTVALVTVTTTPSGATETGASETASSASATGGSVEATTAPTTSVSAATGTPGGSATGTGSGAAASGTETPAGAGPTARAGVAAALGVAAAVALL
ncbi:siderophore biosynthesis protein [Colletotrichum asianum]